MKRMQFIRIIALLVFFSLKASLLFGMTIDGEILVERLGVETAKFPFEAALSTNLQQWQLNLTSVDNNKTNYQLFFGSDGEKTCLITKFSDEKLRHDLGAERAASAIPQATIMNGTYPAICPDPPAKVAWLAFASSSFFLKNTNPLPALWMYGFNNPSSYGVKIDRIEFLDSTQRLPSKIDFLFSVAQLKSMTKFPFLSKQAQSRSEIEAAIKDNQQYDGVLMAEYRVINTTNFQGVRLPLAFDFKLFILGSGNKRIAYKTYLGSVKNVSSKTPTSFLPDIKEHLWTSDYRFSDTTEMIDDISYTLTNQLWPPTNDPTLQGLFERTKQHLPPVPEKNNADEHRKILQVRIAFLLLTLIPIPMIIYFTIRSSKKVKINN